MSRMELHIGKLIPIKTNNIEQTAKEIIEKDYSDYDIYDVKLYDNSYVEYLCDIAYNKYMYIQGNLYVVEDTEFEDCDPLYMKQNSDGSINYRVGFYNGGCCFSEALEHCLKHLKLK